MESTRALHADDGPADVAPPLHVSTTFRYPNPFVYARERAPTSSRLETVLTSVFTADVVTYASGLAALHAAYVLLKPRNIAIGQGYHGSHGVIHLHQRLTGVQKVSLDSDLSSGDLVHLETPLNPTGQIFDIRAYAEKAHAQGAFLLVDATLGPPSLQDPLELGADLVWHSGTKFIGGHSDMLCGVLATRNKEWVHRLQHDRSLLGSAMGNLEAWLGLRSVRTLALRVERQSANAVVLVDRLKKNSCCAPFSKTISDIHHGSLQKEEDWLKRQMPRGFGSVFAITMKTEEYAQRLPEHCQLFSHATSLGGVESLMEWRALSDSSVDRRLVRVSVGIEHEEDLWQDLRTALQCCMGS